MQLTPDARQPWTVLIVRRLGRTKLRLPLPSRPSVAARCVAAAAIGSSVLLGWVLQGRLDTSAAHAIQFAGPAGEAAHWTPFEQVAPANGESGGRSALVHALQLGLGNRIAAVQLWAGKIAPTWSAAAKSDDASDGTLLWPVRNGQHVRGYGSGRHAYHLAIDIAGPRGAPVLAAASGVVGYAGNQMHGYGNLLILVHEGGRATFYAHNQRILVVPGERVTRGQPVAVLGSTGNSLGPHVHFELVYNQKNCDPGPLFRTDDSELALSDVTPATWAVDAPKPRAIRCARRRPHPQREEGVPEMARASLARQPLATLAKAGPAWQSAL